MPIVTFTQVNLEQENNDWCCKQYLSSNQGKDEHQLVTLDAPCVMINLTEALSCELSVMTGSKVRTLLIRNVITGECGVDILISRTLTYVAITDQKVRFEQKENGAILCYLGWNKKCRLLIPPKTPINLIMHDCILDVSEKAHVDSFTRALSCFPKMRLTDLLLCYGCLKDQDCKLDFCSALNVYATLHRHPCTKHRGSVISGDEHRFVSRKSNQKIAF